MERSLRVWRRNRHVDPEVTSRSTVVVAHEVAVQLTAMMRHGSAAKEVALPDRHHPLTGDPQHPRKRPLQRVVTDCPESRAILCVS